jgi:hypothetical protein
MSMKVLEALVGADEVAQMSPEKIRRLCDVIDTEILKDQSMTARLLEVLKTAGTPGNGENTSA